MEFDAILPWLPVLNVIVIPVAGWLLKVLKRDMATTDDVMVQAERISSIERRADLIERDLRHLPDAKDFDHLKDAIAMLSGESKAQSRQLLGVSASVSRIEDYLMKGGK